MYVNAFWFGVLMTIVALIALAIIWAIIHPNDKHDIVELDEEEAQKLFGEAIADYFRQNPDALRNLTEDIDDGK